MIQAKIAELIINSVAIGTEDQRQKLQGVIISAFNLATAADNYNDQAADNEGDDDAENRVAEALVQLSGIVDIGTSEKREKLKAVISDVYTDPDTTLETLGEELFSAAVDFRHAASLLSELFLVEGE